MTKHPWRLWVAVLVAAGLLVGATVTYSPYRPTGPVVFQPGSVTVPQITGTTSLFSGFFWPVANHLGLTISGHEAVRFHATALTLHHTTALRFAHSEAQMHGGQRGHITALRLSTVGASSSIEPDGNDQLVVGHASTVLRFETIGGELFRIHSGGLMAFGNASWDIGQASGSRPNAIHVQTTIEARGYIRRVHAMTIASNGVGASVNTETVFGINTARATESYIEVTCNDVDGCTVIMGETNVPRGLEVIFANVGTNTLNFQDTAGVSELAGAFASATNGTIRMIYTGSAWLELGRSAN